MRANQSAACRPLASLIVLGCVPPLCSSTPSYTCCCCCCYRPRESHAGWPHAVDMPLLGRRFGSMLLAALPETYRRRSCATSAVVFEFGLWAPLPHGQMRCKEERLPAMLMRAGPSVVSQWSLVTFLCLWLASAESWETSMRRLMGKACRLSHYPWLSLSHHDSLWLSQSLPEICLRLALTHGCRTARIARGKLHAKT